MNNRNYVIQVFLNNKLSISFLSCLIALNSLTAIATEEPDSYKPVSTLTLTDKKPGESWVDFMNAFDDPRAAQENLHFMAQESQFTRQLLAPWIQKTDQVLTQIYDHKTVLQTEDLGNGKSVSLIWRGGQSVNEFILKQDGKEKTLFSPEQLQFDYPFDIASFVLSPNKRYAVLKIFVKGDVGFPRLYFVNLDSGQVKKGPEVTDNRRPRVFVGPSRMYLEQVPENRGPDDPWKVDAIVDLDAPNPLDTERVSDGAFYIGRYPILVKVLAKKDHVYINTEEHLDIPIVIPNDCAKGPAAIHKISPGKVALICTNGFEKNSPISATFSVFHLDIHEHGNSAGMLLDYREKGVFDGADVIDEHLVIRHKFGHLQKVLILDSDLKVTQKIPVPSHLTVQSAESHEEGKSILLNCASAISNGHTLIFDYKLGRWEKSANANDDLTLDGVTFINETLDIPARDGILIPTRIVYRKDSPPSKHSTGLIEVYEHGKDMYLYPRFLDFSLTEMFLKKGGIYIAPAIRGGNAFGDSWGNEFGDTTSLGVTDLIDVAEWIASRGMVNKNKLISTGWSAGGRLVTKAALLSPSSFALTVGGAFAFSGAGQYSTSEAEAKQGIPNLFFISGMLDNPENIIKMIRKLQMMGGTQDQLQGVFFPQAGHWLTAVKYHGSKAIHAQAIQWAKIWQTAGW